MCGVSHSSVTTKLFPRGYFLLQNIRTYVRGRAKVDGMPEFEIPRTIVNLSTRLIPRSRSISSISIVKPNVSHILALFTRRNCSANFCRYLERCGGKRVDPSCLSSFAKLLISAKRPSGLLHWCESFYFKGRHVIGWKETTTIVHHC